MRFGCGTIFGFFVISYFVLPFDTATFMVVGVLSLLSGLAAVKLGDRFFHDTLHALRFLFPGLRR